MPRSDLALFRGLFAWSLSLILHRFGALGFWLTPFLWVGIEYLNSLGDLGFPWMVLGNTQTEYLSLIQYAEITGVYGVSFWVVAVNLVTLALLRKRGRRLIEAIGLVGLFVGPASHGLLQLHRPIREERTTLSVGIVQPNTSPLAKQTRGFEYNFAILKDQTVRAAELGAHLVVWPETAVPGYFRVYSSYRRRMQQLADSLDIHILTGSPDKDPVSGKAFNSAFLFTTRDTTLQRYSKKRLVPFGERAPFPELLPFLRDIRLTGGGYISGNFDSGENLTIFKGSEWQFSTMICYDSVFPDLGRQFVKQGAEFLVVITNDGITARQLIGDARTPARWIVMGIRDE